MCDNKDIENPTPEQVKAWMKNHVCIPSDGLPQSFIEQLTRAAEDKKKCET